MSVRLGRELLRELKKSSNQEARVGGLWRYVASEFRKTTLGKEEVQSKVSVLKEYVSYLKSSREHRELLSRYQGRGERSVEETAGLVGFKLPEVPEHTSTVKQC